MLILSSFSIRNNNLETCTVVSLYLLSCRSSHRITVYGVLIDPLKDLVVAGGEQIHVGAQLVAELVQLLSVPCRLLRRRECRTAEDVHINHIYCASPFVEIMLVL